MLKISIEVQKNKLMDYKNKIQSYYQGVFEQAPERENVFIKDQSQLLEIAKTYLETYERKEAAKIIKNKNALIFTSEIHRPFAILYDRHDEVINRLWKAIEKKMDRPLEQIERAFLEWEIYNESEERIIELVTDKLFESKLKKVEKYLLNKKLGKHFSKGEEIFIKDLEPLLRESKEKGKVFYKYV